MLKFIILASLLLSQNAQPQSSPDSWALLVPNTYHGDEAPTKPGTGWLALVAVGGIWRLEPTVVKATRIVDEIVDEDGQKTGIKISSGYPNTLVLLRMPGIQAGKVDTPAIRFKDNPRELTTTTPATKISFKGEEYFVQVSRKRIYLKKGENKTQLFDLSADDENSASLLWAGDLDGDGKLDLLFLYGGQNSSGICLYLSKNAPQGALVKQAACHGGIGC